MKKLFLKLLFSSILVLATGCTPSPEKKIISSLEEQYGPQVYAAKVKSEIDKLFGKESTKLKDSIQDFIISKTKIKFSDVVITENTATVNFNAEQPDDNTLAGLMLLVGFTDYKKVSKMSMNEFIAEASKNDKKRKTASDEDIKINRYAGTINLKKENEKWIPANKNDSFFQKNT